MKKKQIQMKNSSIKRIGSFLLACLLSVTFLCAQDPVKVTGKVIDDIGEPMIGVSVFEKGTSNGVITDLDGNYTLSVQVGATIVYSYIGYLTQELKASGNQINVTLKEDNQALDEVVVVGYGVQKKSNLTGAISSVKAVDIDNRTVSDINQTLQGKTAGVQLLSTSYSPGAESSIRIRGFSSNTTSDPLYVVDGVRVNSISNIDPNDIESIEVLKDAASAAIYGAEAGNGVVLVTTKKGKIGEGKISYNFQYAIQSLIRKPKVMDAHQYLDYMVQANAFDSSLADSWDGTVTDWCDVLFESSPMQKHSLSFQNATEKSSIYASLNYMETDGIVVGNKDKYKRLVGNLNMDYDIKEWLSISTSNVITYMNRSYVAENDQYQSVLRAALSLDPCTPVIYEANNLPDHMQSLVDGGYKLIQDGNGDYYSISKFLGGADDINPYILMDSGAKKNWGTFFQGNTALDLKPIKGLVVTSRLGYRFGSINDRSYQGAYYATPTRQEPLPSVSSTVRSIKYFQWENFVNYMFDINQHNFVAMLGTSYSSMQNNFVTTGGKGLTVDDELYAYPDYLSSNASELLHAGDDTETRKYSYFGRISYDYDSRYMLQFTMRADAADLSILPKAKRWGYFPAVSLGWNISGEKWFPKNTPISNLKLRASWGQNGSIAGLGNFAYGNAIVADGGYSFTPGTPDYITASRPSTTGNLNLKWETSEQTNIGFDARFFNSRLSLGVDYYVKKTIDLIVNNSIPTLTIGNSVSPVNAGDVENKGWEFDLAWKDQIGQIKYGVSANLATLKNKVTYLEPSIDRLAPSTHYNKKNLTAFEKGYPIWYFRGYKVDHIDPATGNPMYLAADGSLTGNPSGNDMTMIGSAIPDFTYGLTLNLSYKNFDLVVFGQGSQGNDLFMALTKTDRKQTNRLACYYTDAWTPQNSNAKYARIDYGEEYYWHSNAAIFDGSYFKIKQIQLGYQLPKSWLRKIACSNVRLYMSLDDFFLFTKYPGMDPEASSGPTDMLGVDMGAYPSAKKIVFGLNVTF